jgi:hypothetical protein
MREKFVSDEQINAWRTAEQLICTTDLNAERWGNRYRFRPLQHLTNHEARGWLNQGGQIISPEGVVELIETHGTGAIEPPMVDGWGREGLVVMLGDGDGNLFVAAADLDDTDVEAELAQGGSLVTCDEFVARFEEHITFDAPPYPPTLTKSWHDARRDMLDRVGTD